MPYIREYSDGFRLHFKNGSSAPFLKDSEEWNKHASNDVEVIYLSEDEKLDIDRSLILSELSSLDMPLHKIERALAGDLKAIEDIKANEAKKNELRAKL